MCFRLYFPELQWFFMMNLPCECCKGYNLKLVTNQLSLSALAASWQNYSSSCILYKSSTERSHPSTWEGRCVKQQTPICREHLQIFVGPHLRSLPWLECHQNRGAVGEPGAAEQARWPSLSPSDLWEGNNELWVAVTLSASDSLALGTSVVVAWKGLCCFPTSDSADRCGLCWLPCSCTSPPLSVATAAATARDDISFNDLLGIYSIKEIKLKLKKINRN